MISKLIITFLTLQLSYLNAEKFVNTSKTLKSQILEVESGKIQGIKLLSRNGRNYSAFLGIRYGEADRFEVARPPKTWIGVSQMTAFGAECYQMSLISRQVIGSEDCLFLNVYTPKIDGDLPVFVWIHGGGMNFGSGQEYDAKYFMDEEVILVTINYRLSLFGFLDTQDGLVEGNLGLKDQIQALNWVQKNIKAFGGNARKLTIAGSSAGAASVNFHMISSMSKGLFQNAISQSGSALVGWVMQVTPKENALKLAEFVNCPYHDIAASVTCLRFKNASDLILATEKFRKVSPEFDLNFVFTPTIESSKVQRPFIKECPEQLLEGGHFHKDIPWISGVVNNEGSLNLGSLAQNKDLVGKLNQSWKEVAPWLLVYKNKIRDDALEDNVSDRIWGHFIQSINESTWQNLTDAVSDRWNVHGIVKAMQYWSKYGNVYPFYFSFNGIFTHSKKLNLWNSDEIRGGGVGHLDELQYLFNQFNGSPDYTNSTEIGNFSQKFVKLWVSFATYGIPKNTWGNAKKWPAITKSKPLVWYEINSDTKLIDDPFKSRTAFWDSLPIIHCPKSKYRDEL